jgi:hypothetical protein
LDLVKSTNGLNLETDINKIFFNINQYYKYYSFLYETDSKNFLNDRVCKFLLKQIIYQNLQYLIIDIYNYKISFKLCPDSQLVYEQIFNYLLSKSVNKNILNIKIDKYYLYIGINFTNIENTFISSYNELINVIFSNTKSADVNFIDNKIKPIKYFVREDAFEYIKEIFLNIDIQYYKYYDIYFSRETTNITIYSLKENPFFGNITVNSFNESIISNETKLITNINLFKSTLPVNFYLRLYVTLTCNKNISIQEYLKIVNNSKYYFENIIKKYSNTNLIDFNKKILDIIINDKVLILSKETLRRIIYQNNIKNAYSINNKIVPFTNRKLTIYQNILLNFYLYYDILHNFTHNYNQTYDSTDLLLAQLIYITKLNYVRSENGELIKTYFKNYLFNNNLFDLIINPSTNNKENDVFIFKDNTDLNINIQEKVIENLVANYILMFISESITVISNIFSTSSDNIYTGYGKLTGFFANKNYSTSIFPYSSSFFMYLGNTKDPCPPVNNSRVIPNTITFFNKSLNEYINNIYFNVRNKLQNDFAQYNTNFIESIDIDINSIIGNKIIGNNLDNIFKNYYDSTIYDENEYDPSILSNFLLTAYNTDFLGIFPIDTTQFTLNIQDYFMYNLFIYADNNLFNKSFQNFKFVKKDCGKPDIETSFVDTSNTNIPPMYNNFIFLANSPFYRIYFLFTFFAYMSLDENITIELPNDFVNLRDVALKFVFEFLVNANNLNTAFIRALQYQTSYINIGDLKNQKYLLNNNFLIYDSIDIFDNEYYKYLLSLNKDNKFLFMYNNFYFNKNIFEFNISDSSKVNVNLKSVADTIYSYLYNYDDKIIILFIEILELNKNLFTYYDEIIQIVNLFFKKITFNYAEIIALITNIIVKSQTQFTTSYVDSNFSEFFKNTFYYNCYYTTNIIGTIFDNTNIVNTSTINDTYNLTITYNDYYQGSSVYVKKSNDVKKNLNFINNINITGGFYFILTLFNNINFSYNAQTFNYYIELVNGVNNYIVQNISYLSNYCVSELTFYQCINKILLYVQKFNKTNNSNVELLNTFGFSPVTSFSTFNIIIIYLLYLSYLNRCLYSDVYTFFQQRYSQTGIDFDTFIIQKYSINIYTECLNDFISILGNSSNLIYFDYSNILVNKINDAIEQINIKNDGIKIFMEKIFENATNIDEIDTNLRLYYDLLNLSSNIFIYNSSKNIFSLNNSFYIDYNNLINNFITEYNTMLFSLYDKSIINKTISSNFLSDVSLQKQYDNIRNVIFNNSIFIIQNEIYSNLLKSSNSGNLESFFSDNVIINILINSVQFFYTITSPTDSYFNTFYNKRCLGIEDITKLENIINPKLNSDLYPITNLIYFYSNYLNRNIINNIYFEKDLNRIIYLLCTNKAINLSENPNKSIQFLKKNTLYNIVKVFKYNNTGLKIYLENTALYQDIDIFQLFNYQNWSDSQTFLQNKWLNKIIENIDTDYTSNNSYYYYYYVFRDFTIKNLSTIVNFILKDGTPVIDYFYNTDNIEEFNNLIFDLITLNDNFSPNNLYYSIIQLKKDINALSYLTIDTDYIKKKIMIFLYFNYLIYTHIHRLLIEYFTYDKELYLEYNIDGEIIVFSLEDVLSNSNNKLIIDYYITESYKINDININNLNFILPVNYESKIEINFLLGITKSSVDLGDSLLILIQKYISSFDLQIGNSDFETTSTITTNTFNSTISNLIQRINIVFNNDITIQNSTSTKLTRTAINYLDIFMENIIYDLNNIIDNTTNPSSTFINNNLIYYKNTDISNINLTFNLICNLLKVFNITYNNLTNDVNVIIGNLRLGTRYINDVLENFKGITSNFNISLDLIKYVNKFEEATKFYNDTLYTNFLARANNIRFITFISSELDNLSISVPNDYDYAIGNIDFGRLIPNFFTKYYSYEYNYYNFDNNYEVIFPKLNDYFNNILENSQSLINIKNYDLELYKYLFNSINYALYSSNYYSLNKNNPNSYINILNKIIELYKKFNFEFKINKNGVSNTKNLELQYIYNKNLEFDNYNSMYNYLVSLYYYILLSNSIDETDKTKSNYNIINFFNTIKIIQNYNMVFRENFINYVFRLQISINLIINIIQNKLELKLINNQNIFNKIIMDIVKNVSDPININNFFKSFYVNTNSVTDSQKLIYEVIVTIIEYDEFINLFSQSVRDLVYYTNNLSIQKNIQNVWEKYFKNSSFNYFRISYYDYTIRVFRLNIDDFTSILYEYLSYYYNIFRVKYTSITINNLTEYLLGVFRFKQNNTIINLDINILETIIFGKEISNNTNSNYDRVYNIVNTILEILADSEWNIISYNYIDNTNKPYIDLQITLFNYYFSFIDYINRFQIIDINSNNFNYNDFISSNNKLLILYRVMILIICSSYIDKEEYINMTQYILTYCNNYIFNGKKINTIDMKTNIATYFDYLNQNIIPNNLINNYYKQVQNNSIIDIFNYKIYYFNEPKNNFDNFTVSIYNKYINELKLNTETDIGKLFINNTILNIINNYSGGIYKTTLEENIQGAYVIDVFKYIIDNISINLNIYKQILGGDSSSINSIFISTKNILQLFNGTSYEIGEKLITIFTIIYRQISATVKNNDIIIILFYYNCFITWISTHCNDYEGNIQKIIYDFTNLINEYIIAYLEIINNSDNSDNSDIKLKKIYDIELFDKFFDGLNKIMFNVYDNQEFINQCYNFFNNLVTNFNYPSQKIINNSIKFNINTFNGYPFSQEINKLIIQNSSDIVYNNYIKNNKINAWKFFLGLIVDFNESDIIKYLKSINSTDSFNPQIDYVNYIELINKGFINEYGILKILDNIKLNFDDEQIDVLNSDSYKIFINLFLNLDKYPAFAQMLGINNGSNDSNIISGIKSYIKKVCKKDYYIPLLFFFNNYKNSIPLIACMYTNITIDLFFNSNNLIKNSYTVNQLTQPNAKTFLNMDFILIEREERKKLCEKYIDNLIETHSQYSQNFLINEYINNTYSELIVLRFDFGINEIVKELIWNFNFYLNDYLITNRYKEDINLNTFNIYDSILNTRFYIDGARRDGVISQSAVNFNGITTNINPNKYHSRAKADNIYNVYSFALQPEDFQPTGAMNLNTVKVFTIEVILDKNGLVDFINTTNKLYNLNKLAIEINLNTVNYNFIRYQSGLSGLLFI